MKKEQKTLKSHSKAQKVFQVNEDGSAYVPNRSFSERFRNAFVKKEYQPLDRSSSDRYHNKKSRNLSQFQPSETHDPPHLSPLVDLARSARTLVCPATINADEPDLNNMAPLRLRNYVKPLEVSKSTIKLPPIKATVGRRVH